MSLKPLSGEAKADDAKARKSALKTTKPVLDDLGSTTAGSSSGSVGFKTPSPARPFNSPESSCSGLEALEMAAKTKGQSLDEYMKSLSQNDLAARVEAHMKSVVAAQQEVKNNGDDKDKANEDKKDSEGNPSEEESSNMDVDSDEESTEESESSSQNSEGEGEEEDKNSNSKKEDEDDSQEDSEDEESQQEQTTKDVDMDQFEKDLNAMLVAVPNSEAEDETEESEEESEEDEEEENPKKAEVSASDIKRAVEKQDEKRKMDIAKANSS